MPLGSLSQFRVPSLLSLITLLVITQSAPPPPYWDQCRGKIQASSFQLLPHREVWGCTLSTATRQEVP